MGTPERSSFDLITEWLLPGVDPLCDEFQLFGRKVLVLNVEGLLRAKRAAGRPKDLLALAPLELLRKR